MPFLNFRLITSEAMVDTKLETAPRNWRERLLSWPWQPWVKTKQVQVYVPRQDYVVNERSGTIICHPTMLEPLKRQLQPPPDFATTGTTPFR